MDSQVAPIVKSNDSSAGKSTGIVPAAVGVGTAAAVTGGIVVVNKGKNEGDVSNKLSYKPVDTLVERKKVEAMVQELQPMVQFLQDCDDQGININVESKNVLNETMFRLTTKEFLEMVGDLKNYDILFKMDNNNKKKTSEEQQKKFSFNIFVASLSASPWLK